jgi:hypothetical protein
MEDEVTITACRAISAGELTIEYATFIMDENYRMECECGSIECRHLLSGTGKKKNYRSDTTLISLLILLRKSRNGGHVP